MLLRESNEHRRQDLEIQQNRGAVRAACIARNEEEEALVLHTRGPRQSKITDCLPWLTLRCAGQDPYIHGDLAFGPVNREAEHGVSFLTARGEREPQCTPADYDDDPDVSLHNGLIRGRFAGVVQALPDMARTDPPAGQDHHDPAGSRAPPPDGAHDGAQLPRQDPVPNVSQSSSSSSFTPAFLFVWRALIDCLLSPTHQAADDRRQAPHG